MCIYVGMIMYRSQKIRKGHMNKRIKVVVRKQMGNILECIISKGGRKNTRSDR